jgi:transcription-repair coupling factor (superfamily II helicase)
MIESVVHSILAGAVRVDCSGIESAPAAYLLSRLADKIKAPVILVMPSMKACEVFAEDFRFFSPAAGPAPVIFPSYHLKPFKHLAYHGQVAAERIKILYQMIAGSEFPLILLPVETLLQRIIPKSVLSDRAELLIRGENIDRDGFIRSISEQGYNQVTLVEEYGEYAVRGGILDIYSPLYPEPLRIELFGDRIESLRFFSATDQRKLRETDEAIILPAREIVLAASHKERFNENMLHLARESGFTAAQLEQWRERLTVDAFFPGIESFIPLVYPACDTLLDYIPPQSFWMVFDPIDLERQAVESEHQAHANYVAAKESGRLCLPPDQLYQSWNRIRDDIMKKCRLELHLLHGSRSDSSADASTCFHLSIRDNMDVRSEMMAHKSRDNVLLPLVHWIEKHRKAGFNTILAFSSDAQIQRIQALMEPYGIEATYDSFLPGQIREQREKGLWIRKGDLSQGFVWPDEGLAVITEKEIFGPRVRHRRIRADKARSGEVKTALLEFSDLKVGDLIVHVDHGIGVYAGLEKLTVERVTSDFLTINYRDDDRLYIPVDRLTMVQNYVGVDGITPQIDKMGGKSWKRVQEKARKSAEKIAADLLDLYASRKILQGHPFGQSDAYFKDFEAGFPFEETPDQLRAIDDVLNDMEAPTPMDRLICGDVGYGKTEVALRAAFKAVNDAKQVAVLVPTTLLAEQHYRTFSDRFSRYPVIIDCLNRFRSRKEQRKIIERLQTGRTDIVVGTHRLLQKDIGFADLGLVVIDEEQRFGVKHKEKLKKIRSTVDVLSMTATPIPRTLHMSLMGVRDISVIQTPPEFRRAIMSYISEFDPAVIADAIRKEMARGGQIFFIHNNINTIWNMSAYLKDLVPEVRLGVAHGRLDEAALESVMMQFINRDLDMLVCTTIVESGLDIPNANTIIINRADRFGLSQIYQLRGRVGRAEEQAYAFLFVPKGSTLTRDAQKRLKVLMDYSDLGAGFQIAMNDLRIRGGGAALGIEQSGHIAAVGYDMFLELLEEAVSRMKGEPVVDILVPEINIPLSVYLSETYIPDIDQRLMSYRRLARMTELKEVADFKGELTDRYGPLPLEAGNLLIKIMLKILCVKAGIKRLDLTDTHLYLTFSGAHMRRPQGLVAFIKTDPKRFKLNADQVLGIALNPVGGSGVMAQARNILIEIGKYVNL